MLMTDVMFVTNAGGFGRVQYGGAERMLSELLPTLADDLDLVCVLPESRLSNELDQRGVRTHLAQPAGTADFSYVRLLRKLMKRERPRALSLHLFSASAHGRVASAGLHIPRQVTLHNDLWEIRDAAVGAHDTARILRGIAIDWMLSRALPSTYVAVSREQERQLKSHGRRTRLVTNGLPSCWPAMDEVNRQAARRSLGLSSGEFVVGYIGRYEKQKGVDRLWEAARSFPSGWRLVVAGEGSIPPPRIAAVMDLGWRVDPSGPIAAFDVAVIPSRWEVFGRVAIEVLSLGCPLIHSGAGGLAEISRVGRPLCTELRDWSGDNLVAQLARIRVERTPSEVASQTASRIRSLYPCSERAWHRRLCTLMQERGVAGL
jgi:glycosyltransferase involved in cell wall biosynthesis